MALWATAEDLGLTEEPYIDRYKDLIGVYPKIQLTTFKQLPVRWLDSKSGKHRYKMRPFPEGSVFQVVGTEKGKRSPHLVVVNSFESGHELVLEPKLIAGSMLFEAFASEETEPASPAKAKIETIPPKTDSLQAILEERKKTARFII